MAQRTRSSERHAPDALDAPFFRSVQGRQRTTASVLSIGGIMIGLAIAALVIGLIASLLGFTSIAGASFAVAKVIAGIFLVLFVVFLLLAWGVGSAVF